MSAIASAYTKPLHTAWTSNAAPPLAPSLACRMHALDGKIMSGVVVATTMRSSSDAEIPAAASACREAASARSLVSSPAAAIRRSQMPVLDRTHSSLVSIRRARSALVSTCAGRYDPVPAMRLCILSPRIRSCGPHGHRSEALRDAFENVVSRLGVCLHERVTESEHVGRSVALDNHALEPDQRGAVVSPRVDATLERPQHGQRKKREQLA